jgi:hypothetical protein
VTRIHLFSSQQEDGNDSIKLEEDMDGTDSATMSTLDDFSSGKDMSGRGVRRRVKDLAKSIILRPLSLAMPSAIAAVLREASLAAVEQMEESMAARNNGRSVVNSKPSIPNNRSRRNLLSRKLSDNDEADSSSVEMLESIIEEAFAPMEASLLEMESSLERARKSLKQAKQQSYEAIEALQMAAMAQAEGAAKAVAKVEKEAQRQVMAEIYSNAISNEKVVDISKLTFDDVDYESSEMAPPFLDPDSCLIPGEPVARVEKAPENSRRIFAGIDIMASVDDVWNVRSMRGEGGGGDTMSFVDDCRFINVVFAFALLVVVTGADQLFRPSECGSKPGGQ